MDIVLGPEADLSTRVEEIREMVEGIDPGVVLVGFSYGGLVVGVLAGREIVGSQLDSRLPGDHDV